MDSFFYVIELVAGLSGDSGTKAVAAAHISEIKPRLIPLFCVCFIVSYRQMHHLCFCMYELKTIHLIDTPYFSASTQQALI